MAAEIVADATHAGRKIEGAVEFILTDSSALYRQTGNQQSEQPRHALAASIRTSYLRTSPYLKHRK